MQSANIKISSVGSNHTRNTSNKISSLKSNTKDEKASQNSNSHVQVSAFPSINHLNQSTSNSVSKSPYQIKEKYVFSQSINSSNSNQGNTAINTVKQQVKYNEKETEILRLKETNLKFISEKRFFTSEIVRLSKELENKDRIIKHLTTESMDNQHGKGNYDPTKLTEKEHDTQQMLNLKRQIKDLQIYAKSKEDECEKYKRMIAVTKIKELREEITIYINEIKSLKDTVSVLNTTKCKIEKQLKQLVQIRSQVCESEDGICKYKKLSTQLESYIKKIEEDYLGLLAQVKENQKHVISNKMESSEHQTLDVHEKHTEELKSVVMNLDEIEEISYLVGKMLKARELNLNLVETYLFDSLESIDGKFAVELSTRISLLLELNNKSEKECLLSFVLGCIKNFSKDLDHFKLKLTLMIETIPFKNESDIESSLMQKMQPIKSSICLLHEIDYHTLIDMIISSNIELTEKEVDYLIYKSKQNLTPNTLYGLNLKNIFHLIGITEASYQNLDEANSAKLIVNDQENPFSIRDDITALIIGYIMNRNPISKTRVANLLGLASQFLNDRFLCLSSVFEKEIILISLSYQPDRVIKAISLASFIKFLLKNKIIEEILQKDVFAFWTKYRLSVESDKNSNSLFSNDLIPYINLEKLESEMQLLKLSNEEKNFVVMIRHYLQESGLNFASLSFLLQEHLTMIDKSHLKAEANSYFKSNLHENFVCAEQNAFIETLRKRNLSTKIPQSFLLTFENSNKSYFILDGLKFLIDNYKADQPELEDTMRHRHRFVSNKINSSTKWSDLNVMNEAELHYIGIEKSIHIPTICEPLLQVKSDTELCHNFLDNMFESCISKSKEKDEVHHSLCENNARVNHLIHHNESLKGHDEIIETNKDANEFNDPYIKTLEDANNPLIEENKETEYKFDEFDANLEIEFEANKLIEDKHIKANSIAPINEDEKEKLFTQSKDFIDNLFSIPFNKQPSIHSFTKYNKLDDVQKPQITERSLISTSSKWKEKSEAFTTELFQMYNQQGSKNVGTANFFV